MGNIPTLLFVASVPCYLYMMAKDPRRRKTTENFTISKIHSIFALKNPPRRGYFPYLLLYCYPLSNKRWVFLLCFR